MQKIRKLRKIPKKLKRIPKKKTEQLDQSTRPKLKERTDVTRGEKDRSLVERTTKSNEYPIQVKKIWGEEVTFESLDAVLYLWQEHMTMLTTDRVGGLRKLCIGLTESQIWELYVLMRDLGVMIDGKPSMHGHRIKQAIELVRKQRAKTDGK